MYKFLKGRKVFKDLVPKASTGTVDNLPNN